MELIRGGRADEPAVMRPVSVEGLDDAQLSAFVDGLLHGRRPNLIEFPAPDPTSPKPDGTDV